MAPLTRLTSTDAVQAALSEFINIGQTAFLAKYGFGKSQDYFLHLDGRLFDSKPIVAAAFGIQHPDVGTLGPANFNGGSTGAARALERLGFEVVTRAQLQPPRLGDEYRARTAIYEAYGGDKVAGIVCFPGENTVNVFSDAEGPYADEPPTLTEEFGYRGEGLRGDQRPTSSGNARLDRACKDAAAVRFWYRPRAGSFQFLTWVAVLGRAWVLGVGDDKLPRSEIEWRLTAVPGPSKSDWGGEVLAALADAAATPDDGPHIPETSTDASYRDLLQRVNGRGQPRRKDGVLRTDYVRSAAARRAVLVRASGRCESPRCTGMPAEKNRRGEPILDVDHIMDLALGGEDHPINMAALCPNCHAAKTRGANASRWRRELKQSITASHKAGLRSDGSKG